MTEYVYKNIKSNDECYTMKEAVIPILDYIKKDWIVWCPFDTQESNFVKEISKTNKVVASHINDGKDFFEYEPQKWDVIISNPPFTNKRKYFERALSFNKPFALIMSIVWLNDKAPKILFKDKQLQLLLFTDRMRFISPNGEIMGKPSFNSAYYCYNFLDKDIVIKDL